MDDRLNLDQITTPVNQKSGVYKAKNRGSKTDRERQFEVTPEIRAALGFVQYAEAQGEGISWSFMNVPEVRPLVRLLTSVKDFSKEYYDAVAGEVTRYDWRTDFWRFQKIYKAYLKTAAHPDARKLGLRLTKNPKFYSVSAR